MTRILIIGPAWVGDMVMAQTLFRLIKRDHPETELHIVAPAWCLTLCERMPEISKCIESPFKHGEFNLKGRYRLGRKLRSENYDRAIIMPVSWKSALAPFFAGIKIRTGWKGEMRYGLLNDLLHMSDLVKTKMILKYMGLMSNVSEEKSLANDQSLWPKLKADKKNQQAICERLNLKLDKPILAICPGAEYGPSKRWPPKYFAEVAKQKTQAGWQVWIIGSPKDKVFSDEIQKNSDQSCVDLIGKTSLEDAIDCLAMAKQVLTNDSGLMHIAAAVDTPMVAIYGSTSTVYTPPLTEKVKILRLGLDCSPCFKRECPLKEGRYACLEGVKPDMVLGALTSFSDCE